MVVPKDESVSREKKKKNRFAKAKKKKTPNQKQANVKGVFLTINTESTLRRLTFSTGKQNYLFFHPSVTLKWINVMKTNMNL